MRHGHFTRHATYDLDLAHGHEPRLDGLYVIADGSYKLDGFYLTAYGSGELT